jgi:hypothetical protein
MMMILTIGFFFVGSSAPASASGAGAAVAMVIS